MLIKSKILCLLGLLLIYYNPIHTMKHTAIKDDDHESEELVVTFNAIQSIRNLAMRVAQQVHAEDDTSLALGEKGWPVPNPYYHQTKRGLFLATESYPDYLCSPWGQVKIYGGGSYTPSKIANVFDKFRESLTLEFVENVCEKGKRCGVLYSSDKIKFYKENDRTPIAKTELDRYRGTSTRIVANYCGAASIYAIKAIDGKELPSPEHLEYTDYRKYEDSKADWSSMTERYVCS